MNPSRLLRSARTARGLSIRELAQAAGVSASTVHRIEQAKMEPTVEMMQVLLEALGMSLEMSVRSDYASAIAGLADAARESVANGRSGDIVRMAAELVARFQQATRDERHRMLAVEPEPIGDVRWDAFVAALAEWMAVSNQEPAPIWSHEPNRYLHDAWWVTSLESMHAWEYAGSPAVFQNHGVYIHRDSLVNI